MRSLFLAALVAPALLVGRAQGQDSEKQQLLTARRLTQMLRFDAGNAGENGYEDAEAELKYAFDECGGEVLLLSRVMPMAHIVVAPHRYWVDGRQVQVPSTFSPPKVSRVRLEGTIRGHQGSRDFSYSAGTTSDCFFVGGVKVGPTSDFWERKATLAERDRVLRGLGVQFQPGTLGTLRNPAVESHFRAIWSEEKRAAAEAERQKRVAEAAAQRKELERQRDAKRQEEEQRRADAAREADAARRARAADQRTAQGSAAPATPSGGQSASRGQRDQGAPANTPQSRAAARAAAADSARAVAQARQQEREAREQRAREEAAQLKAQREADAARAVAEIQAREEERRAAAERQEAAVTSAVLATATMAQGMGASFGGYYLAMDDAPARSTSYTFESLSGFGVGMNWRFVYVDGGIANVVYTDNFVSKQASSYSTVEKNAQGYFFGGGMVLDFPVSESFTFGPSLGYTMVESADASTGGIHAGFAVRMGALKFRAEMGSAEQNFYGVGAYLKF